MLAGLAPEAEAQTPQPPVTLAHTGPSSYQGWLGLGQIVEGEEREITVSRVGDTSQPLTVNVRIEGKSDFPDLRNQRFVATDAHDFDSSKTTSSLTFAAGNTDPQTITIQAKEDTSYEPFERFDVVASGSYAGASFEVRLEGRLNEAVQPTVGITYTQPFRITEGDNGTVTFTMSNVVPHSVAVDYSIMSRHRTSTETVGDGGADMADHKVGSGTVTIPPNTRSATYDVETVEDTVPETDEQFEVMFEVKGNQYPFGVPYYNPVVKFTSGDSTETVVVTIVDDDEPQPGQRFLYLHGTQSGQSDRTRVTLNEGQQAKITVTLVGDAPASDVSIPLKATGFPAGEVTSGDYRVPASVTIKSGQKSASVDLEIIDDSSDERYRELLAIEIDDGAGSWPPGYTKGDRNRFEVVMIDNDKTSASLLNLSEDELTEAAGARTATFQVRLTRRPGGDATGTAPFAGVGVAEGSARIALGYTGEASRNADYRSGDTLTIPQSPAALPAGCSASGEAVTCTVTLTVTDDNLYEGGTGTTEAVKIDLNDGGSSFNDGIARTTGYNGLSLTIEDNDLQPMFSIADASGPEAGNLAFTVTRSGALGNDVSVTAATGDHGGAANPASAGVDYTASTGTLRFRSGSAEQTFQVGITDDNFHEPDETFAVALSNPVDNQNLPMPAIASSGGTAVGTITDNDDAVSTLTLTVDADTGTDAAQSSLGEGGGAKTARVTATLGGTTRFPGPTTVTVTVGNAADDTATEGTDYANVADQTITIGAGAASGHVDFTLTPTDDSLDEETESISIGGTLDGVTVTGATIEITDDDTRGVTVSAAAAGLTLAEADDTATTDAAENRATYTVALDSAPTGTVTIDVESGDTDVATVNPARLTFSPTDWTARTVTVTAVDDDIGNPNNRRTATIAHTVDAEDTDYEDETAASVTVTVTDDEAPTVTIGGLPAKINSTAALSVTFTWSEDVTGFATGGVTVTGGTKGAFAGSGKDYTLTVTPTNGSNVKVEVAADAASDGVNDGPASAVSKTAAWDVTPPTLSIDDAAAAEGGTATFTVSLTGVHGADVTVTATTADGTATAPGDYTHKSEELTIAAGDLAATFEVSIANDSVGELDETFTVELTGASVTVTDATGEGTITGDGTVIAIADATAEEGDNIVFTLTRSGDTTAASSVTWTTGDDTAEGADKATAGTDYTAITTARTVAFSAGATARTITVATADDAVDEPDETFQVRLAAPSGATLVRDAATGTIADDDPPAITISIADAEGPEGSYLEFLVTLSAPSPGNVEVEWGTHPGVAHANVDFEEQSGRLHFAEDEREKAIEVWAIEDDRDDPNETFTVELWNPAGAVLDDPVTDVPHSHRHDLDAQSPVEIIQATGTIVGPAPEPLELSIGASEAFVDEGGTARVTVAATAPNELDRGIRVPLVYSNGTAEDGDYEGDTGLWIEPGRASGSAQIQVFQDADEDDETFTVSIGELRPTEAVAGSAASVELTILDDDRATGFEGISVSVEDAEAIEGEDNLRFQVRLSGAAPGPVTVLAETRPGSARADRDYIPWYGDVRFEPGERIRIVDVWVHDDDIDESHETLELHISDPDPAEVTIARATATGTIKNTDPIPGAWLARFGRGVAQQTVDSVTERLNARREPGFAGSAPALGIGTGAGAGWDQVHDAPEGAGPASRPAPAGGSGPAARPERADGFAALDGAGPPAARNAPGTHPAGGAFPCAGPVPGHPGARSPRIGPPGVGPPPADAGSGLAQDSLAGGCERPSIGEFLLQALSGASFTRTGKTGPDGGTLAWWGRGEQSHFSGREGALGLGGEIAAGRLGVDYARGGWLAGAALAHSIGRGDWSGDGDGEIEASLTSLSPYAAMSVSDRLQVWGTAGVGWGTLKLAHGNGGEWTERLKTDLEWRMAAAGARSGLLGSAGETGPELSLVADALRSDTSSGRTEGLAASHSAVTRLRAGLEGSWTVALNDEARLTPKLELGARHDGGDAENGFGVDVGGGIAWNDPTRGIALDIGGRTLIAHEDGGARDWGVSAAFAWSANPNSEHGLSLKLGQELGGQAAGGLAALFAPEPPGQRFGASGGGRWTSELAYGFPVLGERFMANPRVSYGLSDLGREYSLGLSLAATEHGPDLSLDILTTRRESAGAPPEHGLRIEVNARW